MAENVQLYRGRRFAIRDRVAASLLTACMTSLALGCAMHAGHHAAPTAPGEGGNDIGQSFADLREHLEAGDPVRVAFLGGSLTWGANASDPQTTSYRGLVMRRLLDRYPKTQFRFIDAAIGGTGSRLGIYRLERDVLNYKPDLVFLDFTANDNIRDASPKKLASYEWLVRKLIRDGDALVVSVILPFKGDAAQGDTTGMPGRNATIRIAEAYNVPVADAVTLIQDRLASTDLQPADLWPWDGAHPNDHGYKLFADAAWQALGRALSDGAAHRVPEDPLHGHAYAHVSRLDLATLAKPAPDGWRVDTPSRVAAWYDGLMSRWLDTVLVAGGKGADAKPAVLTFTFRAQVVALFGEETVASGKYRVLIDGELVEARKGRQVFSASAKRFGGNRQHFKVLAEGLDESVTHTLTIEPILDASANEELRFGALCLAGSRPPSATLTGKRE